MPCSEVCDHHGHQEGADAARATLQEYCVLILHESEPADARADDDADTVGLLLVELETRVRHCFISSDDSELLETRHASGFLLVYGNRRVKIGNVPGDTGCIFRGIEMLNWANA